MSIEQERLIALAGVFQAAAAVDRLAQTGQTPSGTLGCLLNSLLITDPQSTLEVYGGDDLNLRDGYKALEAALRRDSGNLPRQTLRYALNLITLEAQLERNEELIDVISQRLPLIQTKVEQFGLTHDNVIASLGALYQDTVSTFKQRIQVHGDMRYLQQEMIAAKVRALLLAGIRSAMLWRQLGGHRWQLVFSRKKMLNLLTQRPSF
ncbi:high frequency lysogenization protein HflD [Thiopseudomonas alkaliphila]|uniref:high frequency lysogenization protein HflD n=1 Tax=Thiopseudomonas alkaliphila TaxID=1697053 RepID=UPI002575EC08|nr:high frequency lysogenization protein HflD [Thiopseudomonas alkaliphila]MDM1706861.1 high frequency lysogenization protein HflD [Thiopseudomonas alkaliphila]